MVVMIFFATVGGLCVTLGYVTYWLCGGVVDVEVWRWLAVSWAVAAPIIVITCLLLWAEARHNS